MTSKTWRLSLLCGAGLMTIGATAFGADSVRVELNKLEPSDGACRAYLLFENQSQHSFSGLTLDLVMFDTVGIIAKRVAVNAASLPADKTSVKLFDIEGLACEDIGRILVNDVFDCQADSGEVADCVSLIRPASRSNVSLTK